MLGQTKNAVQVSRMGQGGRFQNEQASGRRGRQPQRAGGNRVSRQRTPPWQRPPSGSVRGMFEEERGGQDGASRERTVRQEVQAAMGVRSSQLLGLREDFHFGSQGSLYRYASGGVA